MKTLWNLLARWLARKALTDERARLDAMAHALWLTPQTGTPRSLLEGIAAACRATVPAGVVWTLNQRTNDELRDGQILITIERPDFIWRANQ